ncbi:MAG: CDP-diacylglycerol--glycerol-3-phosphate 3-phosphatidyltransferase [Candidatus Rokubacteria bacterium]|nr:CDP-diacylglycerol--glycerol-3-phosphate 3-phosphatidyltransferase [Candidatus Rokubacteria bacterium]MBI2878496.1 CDP-diacylglycerol--glycerol-3-phosphate 3-phosphatidyltransferase [Candidatus Rokubacteria bacterium]
MNLPTQLTLIRISLVPLVVVFLISSAWVHSLIAAAIFVAASLTDWLDGLIARRRHQETTLGKLLDPVADKLLVAAALISLVQIGTVPAWMVLLIVGREFAVTGLRGVAASLGMLVPSSDLAKYKTVLQYVAVTLLILERSLPDTVMPDYVYLSRGVLWAALILTVASGIDYFIRFFRKSDLEAMVKGEDRWP